MGGVHQVRKLVLPISYEKAFDACVKSIETLKRSKKIKEDRDNGIFDAKAGITWKSFGEQIRFIVNRLDDEHTEVEFSSRPAARTTLIDYGKNLKNVKAIEEYLESCKKV